MFGFGRIDRDAGRFLELYGIHIGIGSGYVAQNIVGLPFGNYLETHAPDGPFGGEFLGIGYHKTPAPIIEEPVVLGVVGFKYPEGDSVCLLYTSRWV